MIEGSLTLPPGRRVPSTFYTGAKEVEQNPWMKEATYDFVNTSTWMEVGLQVLAATLESSCH